MYSELYNKRLQKLRNAITFQHNSNVPFLSSTSGWLFYDAECPYHDFYYDYGAAEKAVRTFLGRYDFDAHSSNSALYAFPFLDALGGGSYKLDPETGAMYVVDHNYIFPEDYAYLAKNPSKMTRMAFERKFPDMTTERFGNAVGKFLEFTQWSAKATEIFRQDFDAPLMNSMAACILPPIEIMNSGLRGIKDLSIDLRRHKGELKELFQAFWEQITLPSLQMQLMTPSTDDYVCDGYIAMLAHAFLSVKQFEEVYWPYMKQTIDLLTGAGKTVYIFCESSMMRFVEFFQELPADKVILHIEQDDIFELRKKLPHVCLAGGLPIELLGYGTKEQCIDSAKRLIDGMGDGYIMSFSKVAAYKDDIQRENLLAVSDFIKNYEV